LDGLERPLDDLEEEGIRDIDDGPRFCWKRYHDMSTGYAFIRDGMIDWLAFGLTKLFWIVKLFMERGSYA
jgi:hypothetical protein